MSEAIFLDKRIEGCELAVTDKAKCVMCKKRIAQGTPRLYVFGDLKQAPPDEGIIKIKRFICYKCSELMVEGKEGEYESLIKDGEKARQNLIDLTRLKNKFQTLMKDEKIVKKIKNEEIIQELEHEEDGFYLEDPW